MKSSIFLTIFLLALMTIAISAPVSQADSLTSPLSVEIRPSKNTLRGREPVTGQAVIVNTAPEQLAAVFDVIF